MWVAPGGAWSCPGGDQAEADGVDVTGSVVKPLCWCLATELAYGVGLHMIFEPLPGGPFAGIHGGGKESRGLVRVAEWKRDGDVVWRLGEVDRRCGRRCASWERRGRASGCRSSWRSVP